MPILLYYHPRSPPCLGVRLVAAAIGVEFELKFMNPFTADQFKPEYLKINPQHTVPTIDDDGFILWESRAIATYLIEKYAKNDSLYPKDPKQRAIINQRLYFDMGTLFNSYKDYCQSQMAPGAQADPAKLEKCHEATDYLDNFLEGQKYVAGNQLTVADLIMAPNVVSFTLMDADMSRHKNTVEWLERIKRQVPKYNEIMDEGLPMLKAYIDSILKK